MENHVFRYFESKELENEELRRKTWYYRVNGTLYKRRKPCFIGDKIHLKSREGIFTVDDVNVNNIWVSTKTQKLCVEWWDFKCIASLPMQGNSVYAQLRKAKRNLLHLELTLLSEIDRINEELKGGY